MNFKDVATLSEMSKSRWPFDIRDFWILLLPSSDHVDFFNLVLAKRKLFLPDLLNVASGSKCTLRQTSVQLLDSMHNTTYFSLCCDSKLTEETRCWFQFTVAFISKNKLFIRGKILKKVNKKIYNFFHTCYL